MKRVVILALMAFMAVVTVNAESGHKILVGGSGTKSVAIIAADGTIEWEHPVTREANDVTMLKDGNILFAHVKEAQIVDREHNIVWEYKGYEDGEIQSASELPNGDILVMQNGNPAKLIEVSRKGKVVKEILIPMVSRSSHGQHRNIRKTIDGTYLVPYISGGMVCEFNKDGALIRTILVEGNNFLAVRLPNGNTMVACGDKHRLVEFDKEDNVVWEINGDDLPGNSLFFVGGFHILPNGNLVLANWGGHGHKGEQAQIIEITREKKVVWSYKNWDKLKALSSVQVIDESLSKEKTLYR